MQLREQKTELLMTKSNLIEKLVAQQDKNMKLDQDNKELKDKYDKLKEQFDGGMRNMTDTARVGVLLPVGECDAQTRERG